MTILDRAKGHGTRTTAVPWWAAFGAPLVGVPLLVVLLALGSPGAATEDPGQPDEATFTTEQVQPLEVESLEAEPVELLAPESVEWGPEAPAVPVTPVRAS